MNRIEINTKIELFRRELASLERIKISCGTCEHGARGSWCAKHQARPPEEVAATGCDDYLFDEIPF